jgi:hypothetical protein
VHATRSRAISRKFIVVASLLALIGIWLLALVVRTSSSAATAATPQKLFVPL